MRAAELEKLKIPGLGFYAEERRTYPQRSVASHVLGYAGTDNRGLEGIEQALDGKLAGQAGSETIVRDPFGRAIEVVTSRPERPGRNVRLTIDHEIQAATESILARTARVWGAKGATAIVMDTRTGGVLSMANAPTFDANRFGSAPAEVRRNRAVTDVYEPGSTFKIVTIAGALEDGVVTPRTAFTLQPTIKVADRVIHEAHWRPTQRMSVRQILSESSNIGTVTIAQRLGAGELSTWIQRFGFGSPTGLDYPGESPGMVLPLEKWYGSTIGTVPIGQGIAVTPMQMVSAYATIGNGGCATDAAPRGAHRREARACQARRTRRFEANGELDDVDVPRRRARGHRHRGCDPGLHRRRQDGYRCEAGERPLRGQVRSLVRRPRPGREAAARDPRDGGRAARNDLGRLVSEPIDPRVDIGHVHLKVSDIDRALAFYRDVLGFEEMARMGDQAAFISAGGYHHHIGLNTWESKGASPPPPGTTGLYHVAIRYPDRRALARALRRVVDAGVSLSGASDHGVSEAVYLRDPDDNGIELYRDRPREEWPRTPDGEFTMITEPLDLRALLAEAG